MDIFIPAFAIKTGSEGSQAIAEHTWIDAAPVSSNNGQL
jgi:hypothetical protein